MSIDNTPQKNTSRRGFFKRLVAGAGGLAFANSLREYLIADQGGVIAAPLETPSTDATIYGKYFLSSNGDASIVNNYVSTESRSNSMQKENPASRHGSVPTLPGATATIGWQLFEEPVCWETSHIHTHDELLIFRGMELHDLPNSFDAEIDLWMGEEMEKHTINSATVVFIPKGLRHAPLNFRRVKKPVLFHASPVHLP